MDVYVDNLTEITLGGIYQLYITWVLEGNGFIICFFPQSLSYRGSCFKSGDVVGVGSRPGGATMWRCWDQSR